MSVVEDVRGVVQDLIAPDLRAMRVELDAVKVRLDKLEAQMERFEQKMERRFEKAEQDAQRRHDETMFAVRTLMELNTVNQRLTQLEKALPQAKQ